MGAITPKQQAFIKTLLLERASTLGLNEEQVEQYITDHTLNELTAKSASFAIDSIRKIEVKRVGTDHLPKAERIIVNKYANPCALCGKWATYHKQGDCSAESAIVPDKLTNESFGTIADGFYAMTSSGTNDLVFYSIKTNKGFHNPSLKGQRGVYMVVGGHKDAKLSGERALHAIKRIAGLTDEGRKQAQALFGQEIGQCGACGRHLTDEETRKRGIGNDCAKRLGF